MPAPRKRPAAQILYAGDADLTDEQIAALPFEMYRQGYEYYWKTHAHPGSTFKYTMSSLLDLMRWDATDQIELIDQPLLMIAGSKADSLYMTEDAFAEGHRHEGQGTVQDRRRDTHRNLLGSQVCGCRNGQADAVLRANPVMGRFEFRSAPSSSADRPSVRI